MMRWWCIGWVVSCDNVSAILEIALLFCSVWLGGGREFGYM